MGYLPEGLFNLEPQQLEAIQRGGPNGHGDHFESYNTKFLTKTQTTFNGTDYLTENLLRLNHRICLKKKTTTKTGPHEGMDEATYKI